MTLLLNILWFVLGGFLIPLIYLFSGLLLIITIVGIPFGIQCIKLAALGCFPFGKEVIDKESINGFWAIVFNIIWILVGGFWIAVVHLTLAIILGITIIGIPLAKQHIKLTAVSLIPFGKSFKNL
ncbi:MAG: YccF domain-containing protein [Opitutales bacterium]|nr:YccF domain-containing protein [Opitutales bacterium]